MQSRTNTRLKNESFWTNRHHKMHDEELKYGLDVLQHGDQTKFKNCLLKHLKQKYCEFRKKIQNYVQYLIMQTIYVKEMKKKKKNEYF